MKLAEIFQSNMVLQRDKLIAVFGETKSGLHIVASLTKDGKEISCGQGDADESGEFLIYIAPVAANRECALTVSDGQSTIELTNVAVGDIWLAGGQSNMEFFLRYEKHWEETKKLPHNPDIHMYNVPQRAFEGHTTHNHGGYGYWFDEGDVFFDTFSAPGYSFARTIQPEIGVPVAIIGCNWGGSTASAWVPESVLKKSPLDKYLQAYKDAMKGSSPEQVERDSLDFWEMEDSLEHYEGFEPLLYGRDRKWQLEFMEQTAGSKECPMGPYHMNRPSGLYHNMLKKIIPFSIKGAIWYQGETDCGDWACMYDTLLSEMIKDWRREWNDDFPFIMVQLAPFGIWLACGNEEYHVVRAQQQKLADTMKDVYMASIMDLGMYYDIHPKEKREVGRRLGLLALGHVYDQDIICDAPRPVGFTYEPDAKKIIVDVMNGSGLNVTAPENDIEVRFNGNIYDVEQILASDNRLEIVMEPSSPMVPDTISLAFAWADYAVLNIHNAAGLNMAPALLQQ